MANTTQLDKSLDDFNSAKYKAKMAAYDARNSINKFLNNAAPPSHLRELVETQLKKVNAFIALVEFI